MKHFETAADYSKLSFVLYQIVGPNYTLPGCAPLSGAPTLSHLSSSLHTLMWNPLRTPTSSSQPSPPKSCHPLPRVTLFLTSPASKAAAGVARTPHHIVEKWHRLLPSPCSSQMAILWAMGKPSLQTTPCAMNNPHISHAPPYTLAATTLIDSAAADDPTVASHTMISP